MTNQDQFAAKPGRMPTTIRCDVEYHFLAQGALRHLLERISAADKLSTGERYLCELLNSYFRAWETEMAGCVPNTPAMAVQGILGLLKSIRERDSVPIEYAGLVDALIQFANQWRRELCALASNSPDVACDSLPREAP